MERDHWHWVIIQRKIIEEAPVHNYRTSILKLGLSSVAHIGSDNHDVTVSMLSEECRVESPVHQSVISVIVMSLRIDDVIVVFRPREIL